MNGPTPASYFEDLWNHSDDPWEHSTRFYETRKYDLTAACLDRPSYRAGFEPGCGIGLLTERLAPRCQSLLAWDRHPRAVELAAERTSRFPGVTTTVGRLGADVPAGPFDLLVVSEVLYYLPLHQIESVIESLADAAASDALLVAVHYRRPVPEHAVLGDEVHARILDSSRWDPAASYRDDDVRIDTLTARPAR